MSTSRIGDKLTVDNTTGLITSSSVGKQATAAGIADEDTLTRNADGSLSVADQGSSADAGVDFDNLTRKVAYIKRGSLTAASGGGGIFAVQNTSGVTLHFAEVYFNVQTGSGPACTVDVGVGASSTTSYDTVMDGFSIETGTAGENVHRLTYASDQGTNGKPYTAWPNNEYITASVATGTVTGLVGTYVIVGIDLN